MTMTMSLRIMRADAVLVHVSVDAASDATGTEVGNHLRRAILEALPQEVPSEVHDQFLIATAACEWASKAFRTRRTGVATIRLSQGRPCETVLFPPEHAGLRDDGEAYVVLEATTTRRGSLDTIRTIHGGIEA